MSLKFCRLISTSAVALIKSVPPSGWLRYNEIVFSPRSPEAEQRPAVSLLVYTKKTAQHCLSPICMVDMAHFILRGHVPNRATLFGRKGGSVEHFPL